MSGNLQRDASRILATAWLGLAACTVAGGCAFGFAVAHATRPRA